MDNLQIAKDVLKKYNQEHLLNFYDELDSNEKDYLLRQICDIDFQQIFDLYEASKTDEVIPKSEITPLPYFNKQEFSKQEIDQYTNIGESYIKDGNFAVVTMAGGQGTRLGFKGPKGCFELETNPPKSLFEIQCDALKIANEKYGVTIPWYIMTSDYNDVATKNFFEKHNYFGYPKDDIYFFEQELLPLINIEENLMLEELYKIKEASNGNGNVFEALKKANLIKDMKNRNIKWVFFCGIDNVTLDIVDPLFLGLTISNSCEVASKTLRKKDINAKDWVFVRKYGKPAIIPSSYLSDIMKVKKEPNGHDSFREINMLAHIFSISALETVSEKTLPYHRAFKKNTFVNEEGMKQVPESPNTFKFETFIFDAFSYFDDIVLLRVKEEDEFAPIKDFNGNHNPEVAQYLYEKKLKKQNNI